MLTVNSSSFMLQFVKEICIQWSRFPGAFLFFDTKLDKEWMCDRGFVGDGYYLLMFETSSINNIRHA